MRWRAGVVLLFGRAEPRSHSALVRVNAVRKELNRSYLNRYLSTRMGRWQARLRAPPRGGRSGSVECSGPDRRTMGTKGTKA